jgi:hypothetical protein
MAICLWRGVQRSLQRDVQRSVQHAAACSLAFRNKLPSVAFSRNKQPVLATARRKNAFQDKTADTHCGICILNFDATMPTSMSTLKQRVG